MKLIIAGSRYLDKELVIRSYNKLDIKPDTIICGGSGNIDNEAIVLAEDLGLPLIVFFAGWGKYGKAAGPIRNREMAKYGTHLMVCWDGKSRGIKNMIEEMEKLGKKVYENIA